MSHPTSDEVQHVRNRMGLLGTGDATRLTGGIITGFWQEVQAEVEMDLDISYNSGNALQRGCVADGVAMMILGYRIGDLMEGFNFQLGDFRFESQGLNWNVGIFEAARENYQSRYFRRLELLSSGKYGLTTEEAGDYSNDINTALARIAEDARV